MLKTELLHWSGILLEMTAALSSSRTQASAGGSSSYTLFKCNCKGLVSFASYLAAITLCISVHNYIDCQNLRKQIPTDNTNITSGLLSLFTTEKITKEERVTIVSQSYKESTESWE